MTYSSPSTEVEGFSATPAFLPSDLMCCSERCRCGPASSWMVMMSAPASAKSGMKKSTGVIIRCTSMILFVCGRKAFTTAGPMVRLGT